nr:viral enterotoxin [Porcine rotavirus B]
MSIMANSNENASHILSIFESVQYQTIHDVIKESSPSKLITNGLLSILSILAVTVAKKKIRLPITDKIKTNVRHLAEMMVWKAETSVKEIVDEALVKNNITKDIACLFEEIEKLKQSITNIKGMDVTSEIFTLTEQKMKSIDEKIEEIQKSCERRIKDYDWKLSALTAHSLRAPETRIDIINQNTDSQGSSEAVQQVMNRQVRVKMNSKRQL